MQLIIYHWHALYMYKFYTHKLNTHILCNSHWKYKVRLRKRKRRDNVTVMHSISLLPILFSFALNWLFFNNINKKKFETSKIQSTIYFSLYESLINFNLFITNSMHCHHHCPKFFSYIFFSSAKIKFAFQLVVEKKKFLRIKWCCGFYIARYPIKCFAKFFEFWISHFFAI